MKFDKLPSLCFSFIIIIIIMYDEDNDQDNFEEF